MASFRNIVVLAVLLASGGLGAPPRRPITPVGPVLDKLMRMSPAQRQRQLAKMTPERRVQLEKRLDQYDRLKPEQRERLLAQAETFRSMPADQQQTVRATVRRLNSLPENRRPPVRRELRLLRTMPEVQRTARMNAPQFQKRFSPEERDIIETLAKLVPPE